MVTSTRNSIGLPVINKSNYIDGVTPITNTNMEPFNEYICVGGGGLCQFNYFFPALNDDNNEDIYTVTSFLPTDTVTISVAPASGNIIRYNNVTGTTINAGYGVTITFKVADGFLGEISIFSTNGATFTLT